MRPTWPVVNLIGWTLTGASVTSMVWAAPGPARYVFVPRAPWQSVVSAGGAAVVVGVPGLLLLVLAGLALVSRVSGAGWGFAHRFERGLEPDSRRLYPVYLAVHAGFGLVAASFLLTG